MARFFKSAGRIVLPFYRTAASGKIGIGVFRVIGFQILNPMESNAITDYDF